MRKTFLEPELEVVRFGTEDIITTSFVNDGGTEGNIGGGEDTAVSYTHLTLPTN